MSEEYLDIVDENGNLTGEKELRSVVHAKKLWHQTTHIYFYRKQSESIELLVHLRSKFKEQYANQWATCFGGHLESGSTVEETFIKEMQEEVGISIDPKKIIIGTRRFHNSAINKEVIYICYYEYNDDIKKLTFNDGEVQKIKWMNETEIIKAIEKNPEKWSGKTANGFLEVMRDLKSKI